MTNDSGHGKGSAFLAYWQVPLLRVMLRSTGFAGLLSPLIATAFWHTFRQEYLLSLGTGSFLLALSFASLERARLVAATYVSVALVTALIFGAWFGWMSDVVVVLSYLVVAVGLLFGPRFVYALVALVAASLFLGAVLVHWGLFSVHLDPELDPNAYGPWLRSALGFALLTGAAAWVLVEAVAGVGRAEAEAVLALSVAHDSLVQAMDSRIRRMREEQALLNAQKLQSVGQLGDGFAHVVSNSLMVVRCACEDARNGDSDAARRAAATAIRAAIKDCADRTRDLLLLSRPHSSEPSKVELHAEVRAQVDNLRHRVRSSIRCEFDVEPVGTALVPRSWLPQILTNLVLNAEGAIQGSGTITIRTKALTLSEPLTSTIDRLDPGVYVALEISDDGEGMTPEVMAHACEPFFTTRGRAGHDGLGLTLVHSMLRQVGGTLGITSGGKGSTVTVYLPLAERNSDLVSLVVRKRDAGGAPPPHELTREVSLAGLEQSPSPAAPGTRGDSDTTSDDLSTLSTLDWRSGVLRRTAKAAALVCGLVTVAVAVLFEGDRLYPSLLILSACPLLLVASDRKRLPRSLRLPVLLGSLLLLGALFVVRYSFMSPGSVAALAQVVFLASVFGNRRVVVLVWLVTTLVFVIGGLAWQHGVGVSSLSHVAGDEADNWVRIGVVLPLVLLINGRMVLHMFSVAGDRVRILDRARHELEHRRSQRQAETEALVRTEVIRGRAERTATAGRVTGVVAHDLNNSLMALSGWAELLEDSDDPAEALQNLDQAAEHAEALLQTLRGTTELGHRGPGLDLGLTLGRVRAMLQAVWQTDPEQLCTLKVESESGCFVAIQEASLRRLLVNLVTNARQALGERSGSCTVRVRSGPHGVDLSVVDTGPGMDAATQARIFEPFFTTKPNQGTGLGLLSVSEIVAATDGDLQVESQPDQGCTFTVRWQLAAPAAVSASASAPPLQRGSSARVLLVEDEPLVRELLARGLRSAGYTVVEAEDGDAAMRQLLEQGPFDALCTDAVMPGRSVGDLIQQFRSEHPDGLVLVLSGYLPENLAPVLTNANARLLRKPFSHSRLAAELESMRRSQTLVDRTVDRVPAKAYGSQP